MIMLKCHAKAVVDLVEVGFTASSVALFTDAGWLLHDVATNGASFVYFLIFTGLLICATATTIALIKYHIRFVKAERKELLRIKLEENKKKKKVLLKRKTQKKAPV